MGFLNSKLDSHSAASQIKGVCLICEDECESDVHEPLTFVNPMAVMFLFITQIIFFVLVKRKIHTKSRSGQ
jgi:hypothetical protein